MANPLSTSSVDLAARITGVVRGTTVVLDRAVPPLEGHRVRVVLEPLDGDEVVLSSEEQSRLWREWSQRGEQGPLVSIRGP